MRRQRRRYRKFCVTASLVLAVPILLKGFIGTIPFANAAVEQLAVLSAGIAMPEGGMHLLENRGQAEKQVKKTDAKAKAPEETKQETPEETTVTEDDGRVYETSPPAVNSGPIVRKYYGPGTSETYIKLNNNAYLKNNTDLSAEEILASATQMPGFKIEKDNGPQVLIVHTHTTESYEMGTFDYYDESYNSRTRDQTKNVVAVGEEIAKQLKKAGIPYIHDTTEHDYPSYNGAYDRAAVTIKNILKENPSIKIVLDIHRDGIQTQDGTRIAPVSEINGKNAAQVMIIAGCDDGTMNFPNYLENLKFSGALQSQMEGDFPGLTRPILFQYRKYNEHITTGSTLLEMGSHGNSLEEVIYTGQLVGQSLVNLLESMS